MTSSLPFVTPLAHGIWVIDTGFHRPRFDAAYLMLEAGRAAFIDTGINASVPRLLAALEDAGLRPDAVDYVIATHVHLDHAGGAGLLMSELPGARLVVHPLGARHLIDPTLLMDSARKVYGTDEVLRTYGDVLAVPAARVIKTSDGMTLDLAGRPLHFIDTPGHARHHHCIWDERSRGFFTGDTFGISYREFDTPEGAYALPSSTPTQFQPEALRVSIERLLAFNPERMYVTHYGAVEQPAVPAARLLEQLDSMVALARSVAQSLAPSAAHHTHHDAGSPTDRHAALRQGLAALYLGQLKAHGCALTDVECLDLLSIDIELNAQGLGVWLDRKARA